jgi:hypothetical protein
MVAKLLNKYYCRKNNEQIIIEQMSFEKGYWTNDFRKLILVNNLLLYKKITELNCITTLFQAWGLLADAMSFFSALSRTSTTAHPHY